MNSLESENISDSCSKQPKFSAKRFFLFLPVFLTMIPGSFILFIFMGDRPYGIQLASVIGYSAAAVLYTFSSNRGLPRYLFSCPIVRGQLYRLTLRHFAFLIALFAVETIALQIRPRMPGWWFVARGRNMPPFTLAMFILCGSLLLTQVLTNRSALKRAHLEHIRKPATSGGTLSLAE
jgi:hypothetical protein